MFRLQPPLPDDFTTATSDELVTRVTTARSRLGKRLVILGHHYQREEVIQFADKRAIRLACRALLLTSTMPSLSCSAGFTSWPSPPTYSPGRARR